jgi:ribonucleotide reductase beta subunit family protein with ferritin-like domain
VKLIYEIRLSSNTKKFIKKLKDQKLKQLIIDRIYFEIANEPYKWGIEKQGDLAGI